MNLGYYYLTIKDESTQLKSTVKMLIIIHQIFETAI